MFKITKTSAYTWPVTLQIPADGGKFVTHTFDAKFRRMSKSEVDELRGGLLQDDPDAAAMVRKVIVGWTGVENDEGPIPFSDSALDDILNIQGVAPAIVMAFFNSVLGAARKN